MRRTGAGNWSRELEQGTGAGNWSRELNKERNTELVCTHFMGSNTSNFGRD